MNQISKDSSIDHPNGVHACSGVRDDHLVMFEKHLLNQFKTIKTMRQ